MNLTQQIEAGGLRFAVRPGTSDAKAIEEVVTKHGYTRRWFTIEPNERWLDLGANIGAFTCFAAAKGAFVDAYEAEPANAELARENVAINDAKANVYHCAVVPDSYLKDSVRLALSNTAYGLWRHSLYKTAKAKRSITVPAVQFSSILTAGYEGVKMDIEGAEIDILMQATDWGAVRKLVFEWHFDVNDSIPLFREVLARLGKTFERVEAGKVPDAARWTWFPPARIVHCLRG